MRKFALFAVLSLSAAFASAADLRDVKDPSRIPSVYSKTAKLRVVNLWATWCAPCVAEMPDLRVVDETFGPTEVAFVGVSLDDMIPDAERSRVAAFLDKQKIAYPNVYYTGNPDALGDWFRFDGEIPITLVLDRNGKELWRHQGRINRQEMIAELRKLLRRK